MLVDVGLFKQKNRHTRLSDCVSLVIFIANGTQHSTFIIGVRRVMYDCAFWNRIGASAARGNGEAALFKSF